MQDRFIIIVITSPGYVAEEARKIRQLLASGVDYVHIRKPDSTLREVKDLIEDIPYDMRHRLRLHGHFSLVDEFNLAGVHLNHRNPEPPLNALSITRSCHMLSELDDLTACSYVTLSPIFDSISKAGYTTHFDLDKIAPTIGGKHVVALGGVTPRHFASLREHGFYGAAMLGYVWQEDFDRMITNLKEEIAKIKS